MNKTQINYFSDKLAVVTRQIKRAFNESEQDIQELSREEKVGQILSGKARFCAEKFEGGQCPYGYEKLFSFFEFEGEDEIKARKLQQAERIAAVIQQVELAAERLVDDFVLERVTDPPKAIEEFIERFTPIKAEEKPPTAKATAAAMRKSLNNFAKKGKRK